jgi:hypothetical protein
MPTVMGTTPCFGISRFRKNHGLYSYKLGKNSKHKNPHAMGLKSKEYLKKQGYQGQLKIHERERLSERPFGYVSSKGKFRFDIERVPFYNVPDLTNFKLKPYVPHTTPKIPEEKMVTRQIGMDGDMIKRIEQMVEDASKGRLETTQKQDMKR